MAFWITTILLALVVAGLFALALLRRTDRPDGAGDYDVLVYRDQLAEVDRDLERGVLTQEDAKRVRTEISRRILAADAERTVDTGSARGAPKIATVVALVLVGGGLTLYKGIGPINGLGAPGYADLALADRIAFAETLRESRPSQARAEASLTDLPQVAEFNAEYLQLVQTLRDTVAERPDDIQGHTLLVQNESNLGNFIAAYQSQGRIIELRGEEATVEDFTGYTDLLILAAGGYVSPEAEQAARVALNRDPNNGIARYYIGLMLAQTGRPDMAFRIWDRLLQIGPESALWIAPILEQIPEMALHAGENYQIPTIGNGRPGRPVNGPTASDIESAGEMTGAERIQMIEGMVSGLSDRLAIDGGPADEWAQLIGALGVLGRTDQAFAIYKNAETVFADDPSSLDLVTRAAQRAGVAE
ncbi:c-type cytochrome biogenesis protein CcmI [Ascidiaceihabitans sp.]|nr:c-type cytochrome biogenesis protein CcmI [Ascidiaceihabitans sp.]